MRRKCERGGMYELVCGNLSYMMDGGAGEVEVEVRRAAPASCPQGAREMTKNKTFGGDDMGSS